MEVLSSVKSLVLAVAQYNSTRTESTLSQLLRHIEVLLASLKTNEVDQLFNNRNNLGAECLASIVEQVSINNNDPHLINKLFQLLNLIANVPISCEFLYETFNLTSALAAYISKYASVSDDSHNILQGLRLLERITYGQCVSSTTANLEKLLSFLLTQIDDPSSEFSSVCLGVLSNLVAKNVALQAQVKGMVCLISYSMANKVCVLSIVTNVCWDDDLAKKLFSFKNVPQTLKLLFSRLSNSDDLLTQHRAADLCMELLKHEDMVQHITIYESEQNCAARLLLNTPASNPQTCKILEVLLSFCRVSSVRRLMHDRILKCDGPWKALLGHASAQVSRSNHVAALLALDLIQELSEVKRSIYQITNTEKITDYICVLLTPSIKNEDQSMSEMLLNSATSKTMKSLQILSCLCNEEELRHLVADEELLLRKSLVIFLLNYIFCCVSVKIHFFLIILIFFKTNNVGIDVVLSGLELVLKLKPVLPDLERLLYSTLQDNRIVPFIATAITCSDRNRVQTALRLHQEALPLPDFPAVLLADKIANINKQQNSMEIENNFLPISTPRISARKRNKPSLSSSNSEKQNLKSLIARIENNGETDNENSGSGKTSEIMEIYEHKITSLVTKECHLEDLLEAKTLALAQADRLIAQHKFQRGRCEDDARRMAELLKESEAKCEGGGESVRASEVDRVAVERELDEVINENRNLQKIADQYDQMQSAYQDKTHKVEVLERNLRTSRQEYDTLKELHDMIQKHNEKVKKQLNAATSRSEELEESRLQLMRRISELESSVSDLTQLVEEQDKAAHQLQQDKMQSDAQIKKMKVVLAKKEDEAKELKIKLATLNEERADGVRALAEKENDIETLRQKLDKQAQTLLMITELS
uniref:CIP2A N-terminal domain-containing protein n=1 Tax=Ciona savignyi TaxID=51511 RepID=H2YKN4_CIOSA